MSRLALALLLLASPALADSKPPVWIFVAKTSEGDAGPIRETASKPYATEAACDDARNDWLRTQRGPILIHDLGPCAPVAVAPARGK